VEKFLDKPPLVDLRGGGGANFLVLWEAGKPVNKPAIEVAMINTSQQQGI
jgi:hypothetical protein